MVSDLVSNDSLTYCWQLSFQHKKVPMFIKMNIFINERVEEKYV